jgi:hypothetical protein
MRSSVDARTASTRATGLNVDAPFDKHLRSSSVRTAGSHVPFRCNGAVGRAEVTTTGPVVRDPVLEVAAVRAEQ